jgi:glucosamine--fructose-6-phosphate aminotransferase (isomerizing)
VEDASPQGVSEALAGALDAACSTADSPAVADALEAAVRELTSVAATAALLRDAAARSAMSAHGARAEAWLQAADAELTALTPTLAEDEIETRQAALLRARDAAWALRMDRLGLADHVDDLLDGKAEQESLVTLSNYASLDLALSSLDRLEVRGRDSAGIAVWVRLPADLRQQVTDAVPGPRLLETAARNRAVVPSQSGLVFFYKVAKLVGSLGDNTAALREEVRNDALLKQVLSLPEADAMVLAHTRWASIGRINEPNAHPVDSRLAGDDCECYAIAALNGDVDNHEQLKPLLGIPAEGEITTDAKVIPVALRRQLADGPFSTAAAATARELRGSFAVVAMSDSAEELLLAVRGSGQSLFLGHTEDRWIVASEVYGLVHLTERFLRVDGSASDSDACIVLVPRDGDAVRQVGTHPCEPLADADYRTAGVRSRDIARGSFEHYLEKELADAPESMRKTLRGRLLREPDGTWAVRLGEANIPQAVREAFAGGRNRRVLVVGQGTASVAGRGVAQFWAALEPDRHVVAMPATELSAWHLDDDMSDTCLLAISQSGTTTDTNRAVRLAQERGASVIAIVNRRDSDLALVADGVVYTADGRDVEMAVASTKAFYSQIVAGILVSVALSASTPERLAEAQPLLDGLDALPALMLQVLSADRSAYRDGAALLVGRRYWSIAGSGLNHVAALETRIKLSELCYRAVAVDYTEDKKHIDLSAESAIILCATGLRGAVAEDAAKEVAIWASHRNPTVVIAEEGHDAYTAAEAVVRVPVSHPQLAWLVGVVAGHVLSYETARRIDELCNPLREAVEILGGARADTSAANGGAGGGNGVVRAQEAVRTLQPALHRMMLGAYDGVLPASLLGRLHVLSGVVEGRVPASASTDLVGEPLDPGVVLERLQAICEVAVEELARPIDTIKHQAKTVTVGTSRSGVDLPVSPLLASVLDSGVDRGRLPFAVQTSINALSEVVSVLGTTRYRVGDGTLALTARTGSSVGVPTRTDADPTLRGTKRQAAVEQQVLMTRGRKDGRLVMLVPEVTEGRTVGLLLLHVGLPETVVPDVALRSLRAFRHRHEEIVAAVTEVVPTFPVDALATIRLEDVLTGPVPRVAEALVESAAA